MLLFRCQSANPNPEPLPIQAFSTQTTTPAAPNLIQSPTSTSQTITPTSTPPATPAPQPSGILLFSSRQIDTNGDGFVQVPDAIHIYKIAKNSLELIWINEQQLITIMPQGESTEIMHLFLEPDASMTQLTRNSFFESNIDWKR